MTTKKWNVEIVWTPISEQMPEYGSRKLILDDKNKVHHGICIKHTFIAKDGMGEKLVMYPDSYRVDFQSITHWADYPEEPKPFYDKIMKQCSDCGKWFQHWPEFHYVATTYGSMLLCQGNPFRPYEKWLTHPKK